MAVKTANRWYLYKMFLAGGMFLLSNRFNTYDYLLEIQESCWDTEGLDTCKHSYKESYNPCAIVCITKS